MNVDSLTIKQVLGMWITLAKKKLSKMRQRISNAYSICGIKVSRDL